MKEEFRDVPGYEGMYEVSNLGRVRRNGKILKPTKNRYGYFQLVLSKDGITRTFTIHRLVAYAFINNPNNYPQINHKDEDKTNNTVNNLEWCDSRYNNNYGTINERIAEKHCKPVLQYDLQGNFIREWSSMKKVEEELGIKYQNISKCCSGKIGYKSAGGYLWQYKT